MNMKENREVIENLELLTGEKSSYRKEWKEKKKSTKGVETKS